MNGTRVPLKRILRRVLTLALVLLTAAAAPLTAAAAPADGPALAVERLYFRDILRRYASDPGVFGADGDAADDQGVTAAAKRLAALFAATVGLKYYGVGQNYDYFPVDVTDKYDKEPYVEANHLASADVEILPARSGATALPAGETTAIHVYLAGYATASEGGVAPIYHYLWQDNERWYAVRDDLPYYSVSYNGKSAGASALDGMYILRASAVAAGTASLSPWSRVSQSDGETVDFAADTVVVGRGGANLFAVAGSETAVGTVGVSAALREVSDFVPGSVTVPEGPLVSSWSAVSSFGETLSAGDTLQQGVSYRFRLSYSEALSDAPGQAAVMLPSSELDGEYEVSELVWYGADEYLSTDSFNPRSVEFSFLARSGQAARCAFTFSGVVGSETGLAPAVFRVKVAEGALESNRDAVLRTLADCAQAGESAPLTRDTLARLLWTICTAPELIDGNASTLAADWARETGLILGYEDGSFGGERVATRQETAVVLCRYAKLLGADVTASGALPAWSDAGDVSAWAVASVSWCAGAGLLPDPSQGALDPRGDVRCGELADMLAALMLGTTPSA